jgi:hypothetical protein
MPSLVLERFPGGEVTVSRTAIEEVTATVGELGGDCTKAAQLAPALVALSGERVHPWIPLLEVGECLSSIHGGKTHEGRGVTRQLIGVVEKHQNVELVGKLAVLPASVVDVREQYLAQIPKEQATALERGPTEVLVERRADDDVEPAIRGPRGTEGDQAIA